MKINIGVCKCVEETSFRQYPSEANVIEEANQVYHIGI